MYHNDYAKAQGLKIREILSKQPKQTPEEVEAQYVRIGQQYMESRGLTFTEGPLDDKAKARGRELLEKITNPNTQIERALHDEFLKSYKIPAGGVGHANGGRSWNALIGLRRNTSEPMKSKILNRIEAVLVLSAESPEEASKLWSRHIDENVSGYGGGGTTQKREVIPKPSAEHPPTKSEITTLRTSDSDESAKRLYFAYGSNMANLQMKNRCPDCRRIDSAKLPGYRWIISSRGFATIIPSQQDEVEGVLFEISDEDEKSLDCYEGTSYEKKAISVETQNGQIIAFTYIDRIQDEGKPKDEYIKRINKGLEDANLSIQYINKYIKKFIPFE